MPMCKGIIKQFQSMGTLDGPGLRYVIFMQGCPLRCVYCHNPETWETNGQEYTVDDIMDRILRCKSYIWKNGGVTVSGGEPLMQSSFLIDLFRRLKKEGICTGLDTSGSILPKELDELLEFTDIVICDLKFSSKEDYIKYTGGDMDKVLKFLKMTEEKDIPLWIRHVVVPGITDSEENIRRIKKIAISFSNLEKIELLPFRKLCLPKYETMGLDFPLKETEECNNETIIKFKPIVTL